MNNFIVSARKYRPATFNTVVGQPSIVTTLKNAIRNDHLAQAFLFCGPRGVGKTTCARILAKTINCENLTDDIEPCNECGSCQSFNKSQSLNIYELDAASNNSVEDIRNLVEQVRFSPQSGTYKIYIIDEVHMLSQSAFNAFLKTLEEPPAYAIFILATTEKHKIIPTILSRCQIFNFNRINIDDISGHLAHVAEKENINAEHDALHMIAQKADGALRDALSIFDQIVSYSGENLTYQAVIENLNILDYDYYFRFVEQFLGNNITESLLLFNEILKHGFDGHNFITGLGEHFRNLLVCQDASTVKLLETGENIRERYREQSSWCPESFLLKGLELINECDSKYKMSRNQRLSVELCLMQLCTLTRPQQDKEHFTYIPPANQNQPAKPIPSHQSKPVATTSSTPEKKEEVPAPPPKVEDSIQKESNETQSKANPEQDTQEKSVVPEEIPSHTEEPNASSDVNEADEMPVAEKRQERLKKSEDEVKKNKEEKKLENKTIENDKVEDKKPSYKPKGKAKTLSINQLIKEKKADKTDEETQQTLELDANQPANEFSEKELVKVWKQYSKQFKDNNPSFYSTLTKRDPVLKESFEIELVIDNRVQQEELEVRKIDLLGHIRKSLNNFHIQLTTVISKSEEAKKAYTPKDKFEKMARENPSLNTLKQQLDLDIEM